MILAVIKDPLNIKLLTDFSLLTEKTVNMQSFKNINNITSKPLHTINWNKFVNFFPLLEFKDEKIFIDAFMAFKRHKLDVNYAIYEEESYLSINGFTINGKTDMNKIIMNEITDYLRQYRYNVTAINIDNGTRLIIK